MYIIINNDQFDITTEQPVWSAYKNHQFQYIIRVILCDNLIYKTL